MSARARAAVACGAALLFAEPRAGSTQERAGARTRVELQRFAEILELAAGRVSRPSPLQLMGPATGASGYLLPGYGAVFVLSARALPSEAGVIVVHDGPPGSDPVISILRRDGRRLQKPKGAPRPREAPEAELNELDRDLQQIENMVAAYSREAELARREAELAFERMAQELRGRFPEPVPPAPAAPAAPTAASPPAAPVAPTLLPPPAPPWRFWFQADDDGDPRPPEQVVSEVKLALIQALEARGGQLTIVRPDDTLVVAVDFTARGFPLRPERRAERTLIVTAKKRDLDERRAGRIGPDELRKRIATQEY